MNIVIYLLTSEFLSKCAFCKTNKFSLINHHFHTNNRIQYENILIFFVSILFDLIGIYLKRKCLLRKCLNFFQFCVVLQNNYQCHEKLNNQLKKSRIYKRQKVNREQRIAKGIKTFSFKTFSYETFPFKTFPFQKVLFAVRDLRFSVRESLFAIRDSRFAN